MSDNELVLNPPLTKAGEVDPRAAALTRGNKAGIVSERLAQLVLALCALFSATVVLFVVVFVFREAIPVFVKQGWFFVSHKGWDSQLDDAWSNTKAWFGVSELIAGSIMSSIGAVLASVVLGLGCAVFLAELAPRWLRTPVQMFIQLLAGIPSVVFGLVGLLVVVPFITKFIPSNAQDVVTDVPLDGASLLAAIVVLTFMILPFFTSVAVDSLNAVPRPYLDGALALGLPRWRSISKVQIPTAVPGLLAGATLAAGRAIGEAIAISMVAGSLAYIPNFAHGLVYFPFMPIRTLASAIVENGGETMNVPNIRAALFGLAALLLVFSLVLSLTARALVSWYSKSMAVDTGRSI